MQISLYCHLQKFPECQYDYIQHSALGADYIAKHEKRDAERDCRDSNLARAWMDTHLTRTAKRAHEKTMAMLSHLVQTMRNNWVNDVILEEDAFDCLLCLRNFFHGISGEWRKKCNALYFQLFSRLDDMDAANFPTTARGRGGRIWLF